MRNQIVALILALLYGSAAGAAAPSESTSTSVQSRTAAQNALFEEYYQFELKTHPERATSFGDYRYNDRLDEYSLSAIQGQHASDRGFLSRLEQISTDGLP